MVDSLCLGLRILRYLEASLVSCLPRNPFYYSFLTDLNWLQAPVDLNSWKDAWTRQRYGRDSQNAQDAFGLLLQSVYSIEHNSFAIKSLGGFIAEKNADGLTALPLGGSMATPHQSWYPLPLAMKAWGKMIAAAEEGQGSLSQTMNYDLVNLGREAQEMTGGQTFRVVFRGREWVVMRGGVVTSLICTILQLSRIS